MMIREFLIGIGAKVDSGSIRKADMSMESMKKTALATSAAVAGIFAIGYAVRSFVDGIANAGDETIKTAQNIGVAVDELQALTYSGGLAGVSAAGMSTSIRFLARNMSETSRGTGTAKKWFDKFGISVKNADGSMRSQTDVMAELADRFKDLNEIDRVGAAMDIFGRSGVKMVGMLAQGADKIREYNAEAREIGAVIPEDQLRAMEEYNDMNFRASEAIRALKTEIASALIPVMIESARSMKDMLIPAVKWVRNNSDKLKEAVKGLVTALKWLAAPAIATAIGGLVIGLKALGKGALLA